MTTVDSSDTSITITFPEGVDADDLLFALECGIRRSVDLPAYGFDLTERLLKARKVVNEIARKSSEPQPDG